MCNLELPFSLTEKAYGAPVDKLLAEGIEQIPPFIEDGLVEMDSHGLRITEKGRYFVRNVAMTLDAYLGDDKTKPVFSKTI
jgi:oxygen-independent coproporphyrinogen-3 oxidase